jgi:UDP:flavonoid glycosyltransferase YjiC (YdhE family)
VDLDVEGDWKWGRGEMEEVRSMEEHSDKGTLFFYGLPAYGHTLSNLYLAGRLAGAGFRVVYYSAEPFRENIEENGCEYRAYPMDWAALDLTDGERILKLYRLVLEYTWRMLPKLLEQAEEERPCGVIFDSLALWGRAVGQLRGVPSFAFYSIAAIDWIWGFPRVRGGGGAPADSAGSPAGFRKYGSEEHREGITAGASGFFAMFRKPGNAEREHGITAGACAPPARIWKPGSEEREDGITAGACAPPAIRKRGSEEREDGTAVGACAPPARIRKHSNEECREGIAADASGFYARIQKPGKAERRDGAATDAPGATARLRKHSHGERTGGRPTKDRAGLSVGLWKYGHENGDARRFPVSPWGKGLGAYAPGFSADFLRYAGEIPGAAAYAKRLRKRYGLRDLGLLPVLMNRGDYNLCGYARLFQPGGRGFGGEYRFVGPLSVHRKIGQQNDFSCWDEDVSTPLIYISLGTVFHRNEEFLRTVVEQLGLRTGNRLTERLEKTGGGCPAGLGGGRSRGESFRVVLVWSGDETRAFPENFTVRPFVNQNEILKHAALFITAGGMNSLHEALYFGVPCLMCPQQGEQRLNARRFERLGFGKILQDPRKLRREAWECMELKKGWDEKLRRRLTGVCVGKALELIEAVCTDRDGMGDAEN